jgi:hypothetical protein
MNCKHTKYKSFHITQAPPNVAEMTFFENIINICEILILKNIQDEHPGDPRRHGYDL